MSHHVGTEPHLRTPPPRSRSRPGRRRARVLGAALALLAALAVTTGWPPASSARPPAKPAVVLCTVARIPYQGASYCPTTLSDLSATTKPAGTRVVVRGVSVDAVTETAVTVAVFVDSPCPTGKWCGAALQLVCVRVPWPGTSKPGYGDVIDLYGTVRPGTLDPVGYVTVGYYPTGEC